MAATTNMAATTKTFDHTYDVVVVGSGAAAMATALGAVDEGLSVLMVESTPKWGGNTAMSGGGLWLPNNPLMQADRAGDSREEALAYMEATIGESGRASTRERKEAFVDGVADLVDTAAKHGLKWARAKDYADYYPEKPGGKIGRGLEVEPFDLKAIGDWWESCQAPAAMPIKTDDVWLLGRAWSTPGGMVRGAQLVGRVAAGLAKGKKLAGIGAGFASAMLEAVVVKGGADLWLESPATSLIQDGDGRVIGSVMRKGGRDVRVGATRGVMLAGGGFDHNKAKRLELQGIEGTPSGAPGNLGGPIAMAADIGAALELMDDAWWGASLEGLPGGPGPGFLVGERSFPYSMIVDGTGERFANESESYVDLGHHMLERVAASREHGGAGDALTFWMITDARHARRYLRSFAMDPKALKKLKAAGIVQSADSIEALAVGMGVPADTLRASIERFNGFARSGVDGDFGRGNSAYDRYYGDPLVRPNPNLGPLEKAPFHAYRIVIGDLGTKGGVVTNADARALREDGSVIEGLYAAGNNSASVMGRTYPGPGSTIGPATVFGLRGARHMARG